MKKRLLTFIVLASIIPQTIAYNDYDLSAANFLAKEKIIKDWSNQPEKFELNNNITRREMLKVMINLSGLKVENKCDGNFKDLTSSDWSCKYAEKALKASFIAANENFRPNDNITKIESLKLIMQAKYLAKSNAKDWRKGYVEAADKAGILNESFDDYDTLATRAWIFDIGANTYNNFVSDEEEIKNIIDEFSE
ncbi:hypothetical protein CSB07_01670 [Candidatus Gracilibacteria bacterium]|nr:MAG: hypothetical protein CSB07_01670 [Candidatus Gracilibacteria bacterium]